MRRRTGGLGDGQLAVGQSEEFFNINECYIFIDLKKISFPNALKTQSCYIPIDTIYRCIGGGGRRAGARRVHSPGHVVNAGQVSIIAVTELSGL